MTCTEFREALFGDGSLLVRFRQFAHRQQCQACQIAGQEVREVKRALQNVPRHEPPPGLRERIVAPALGAEGEAASRGTPSLLWRSRWAALGLPLLLIALIAVLVVGPGRPKSALAQALAELRNAETLHLLYAPAPGCPHYRSDTFREEFWIAGDGRFRWESYMLLNGREYRTTRVRDAKGEWRYSEGDQSAQWLEGCFIPKQAAAAKIVLNPELLMERLTGEGGGELVEEASVDHDGRPVLVYSGRWQGGDTRIAATVDANSKRLVAVDYQELVDGQWETARELRVVEYNVPLADELFTFEPPPGVEVVRHTWWKERGGEALAEGVSCDVRLAVHAIDVLSTGDVVLSLSTVSFDRHGFPRDVCGRLLDDEGRAYAQCDTTWMSPGEGVPGEGMPGNGEPVYWELWFTPVEGVPESQPARFSAELRPCDVRPTGHRIFEEALDLPEVLRFDDLPAHHLALAEPAPSSCPNHWEQDELFLDKLHGDRRLSVQRYREHFPE